jgi:hypothetical protein
LQACSICQFLLPQTTLNCVLRSCATFVAGLVIAAVSR